MWDNLRSHPDLNSQSKPLWQVKVKVLRLSFLNFSDKHLGKKRSLTAAIFPKYEGQRFYKMTFYFRHQFEHNVEYWVIQFSRGNAKKSSSPSSAGARR